MIKHSCPVCQIVGLIAVIGSLNSGLVGLIHTNYIDKILSHVHLARVFDIATIIAALVIVASYFVNCAACKK
ncbi:MAG: hypothetical protein HQL13_06495 [Candidatus Omnitrophica bacterium]|nr:hypothetical protein [Candidatus Omnitrophota bacterium]